MGLPLVLLFYAVALSIIATIGAAILGSACWFLTRGVTKYRMIACILCVLFPYGCVAYAGGWFIAYAAINNLIFHRAAGLGDSWETPLPNGYQLMMIDVTDQGTVYNPKTQGGYDSVSSREDAVFGVRKLQVAGRYILGARDSQYMSHIVEDSKQVDIYFELDTQKNAVTEFASLDALRNRAAADGLNLQLRDFWSVFFDYRNAWFDYVALVALLVVPATGFALLCWIVWKVRRASGFYTLYLSQQRV